MTDNNKMTNHEQRTMKAAWDSLLKGDVRNRDSLMEDLERARFMDAKERALQKLKEIAFFVRRDGVSIKSRDVMRVAL